MKHLIYILPFLILSCDSFNPCKHTEFPIVEKPLDSIPIRLNGFYYGEKIGDNYQVIILNENGVLTNYYTYHKNQIDTNISLPSMNAVGKYGLFSITGSDIKWNTRIPKRCGTDIRELQGQIINDSTILFSTENIYHPPGLRSSNPVCITYHFHPSNSKPDSLFQEF